MTDRKALAAVIGGLALAAAVMVLLFINADSLRSLA